MISSHVVDNDQIHGTRSPHLGISSRKVLVGNGATADYRSSMLKPRGNHECVNKRIQRVQGTKKIRYQQVK